jgi:hypothetical protein
MHEDQGMMGQFLVLQPGQRPTPMRMEPAGAMPMPAGHH